jgi:hypothetical protein
MVLTEPQAIFLGVAAFVAGAALVACWALGTSEVRCCRICERMEIVEPSTPSPNWAEPTLCMTCATFKAALRPEVRDGNR